MLSMCETSLPGYWSLTSNGAPIQLGQKRYSAKKSKEHGDMWDHVVIDLQSKLMVSLGMGKRTEEQTLRLVMDAKSRLAEGCLPAIFTNAYECYTQVILQAFGRRYPVARRGDRGRRPQLKLCRLGVYLVNKHYQGRRVREV